MKKVTQFEGMMNTVQQEYPNMLGTGEVQNHLRHSLYYGLHKQLCDSMHYLYNDLRKMYPHLMTAACKAESEQADRPGEGV